MQGRLLITGLTSLILLSSCSGLKMQHPDSSIKTHNICYELRQQINMAQSSNNNPNVSGDTSLRLANLYKLYKKYHCDESEPAAYEQQANQDDENSDN